MELGSVLAARARPKALADQVHDGRISERGDITHRAVLGDVAKEPAHDLAGASLRQLGHDHDLARFGDRPDLLGNVLPEFGDEALSVELAVLPEDHEGDDALT